MYVPCVKLLQLRLALCDPLDCPWSSSGKNTGVGCHALLQGIFLMSLASPALAGRFFTTSATWESQVKNKFFQVLQPWSPDPHDSPG